MDTGEPQAEKKLPFNNLYLNAGVIHGLNDWWMYVLGLLFMISGVIVYSFFISIVLSYHAMTNGISQTEIATNPSILFDPEKMGINKNLMLLVHLIPFLFIMGGLIINLRTVHKKAIVYIITAYDKIRWRRFFFGFLIWGSLIAVFVVIGYYLDKENYTIHFNISSFLGLIVTVIILIPFQSCTEEIVIRGYFMQGLSQVFKNGIVPLIVTSILFGLLHAGNPEVKEHGISVMLPYYCFFGFFLGAITLLDEGLELAMGIHSANNLVSSLLITSHDTALQTDALFVAKTVNPSSEMISWAILATITFIIFWRKYRWKNFNLLIK